jgi:HD-GYP domain-containing protein (c-di-GMP phosphodiesterase class II)
MTKSAAKLRTTIQLTLIAVFLLATILTAALAIGLQYQFGKATARESATGLYAAASSGITAELVNIGELNANIINLLAQNTLLAEPANETAQLAIFTSVLEHNPLYYGLYVGRSDGSFYEVVNLETSAHARKVLHAAPTDRWVVISISGGEQSWIRSFQYLDENLQPRTSRTETTEFDVTNRPWYAGAINSDELVRTDAYYFAQLGVPGRTLSKRIADTGAVVAIDMTLSSISAMLRQNAIADHSDIYVFSADGTVIASSLDEQAPEYPLPEPGSAPTAIENTKARPLTTPELSPTADIAPSFSDLEVGGSSSVPFATLVRLAADPQQYGQLVESREGDKNWLIYVAATGSDSDNPLYVGILAPLETILAPYLQEVKLSIGITAALLLLLLPLSWVFASPISRPVKQLAVQNDKVRRREYSEVERVSSRVKELDDLSESMVNMVSSIQVHELAQRKLMDSFIELIAQAIDDKSAYTGGHCERVPELAIMLAEQASNSEIPAFAGFQLSTEDQWREFRIAAWLHDCGKITTPEHIVDKGSKLETIYNRIHEVRMRFEVLWRDAEIIYLKAINEDPAAKPELETTLLAKRKQLTADFNFVAECNVGGEYLDPEKQERLRQIAQATWLRYFDDRIGLSPLEELRTPRLEQELPVAEPLLSDKPWHIIERERSTDYPAEFGIDMDIPEHLYNQGELYNLSISRGTLTTEDRFKINEHMISTIKMLESLPFPEELKNVPRYASTHHETMRGSGYPRKLPGEQLSIPERILAIADIFEALTASDRPYKKAKPVSVALDILYQMALDDHVDRDCFELFIREKVYLQYAREFLDPAQLDEVDLGQYLQSDRA